MFKKNLNKSKVENNDAVKDVKEVEKKSAEAEVEDNKLNEDKVDVLVILEDKLQIALGDGEKNLAGWQRCQADYQNAIKEHQQKMANCKQMVVNDFLTDLLPIIDHYQMALQYVPEEVQKESWFVGIVNIKTRFEDILKKAGVKAIEAIGQDFDPMFHEAVSMEHNEEFKSGQIIKELSRGYKINDKVIQQAKVIVAE